MSKASDETRPTGFAGRASLWLTSTWGFEPDKWALIGFADPKRRQNFINKTNPGVRVAIYVTKNHGPAGMRGKVVGIFEMSHETAHAKELIAGDAWIEKQANPEERDQWLFGLRVTRAWRIVQEEWASVDELFEKTYSTHNKEFIGANCVPLDAAEAEKLAALHVFEVPVYRQARELSGDFVPFAETLQPSRAVPPARSPYWVGESDGPKHLYILRLNGDVATYLGCSAEAVEGKSIIKVGLSRSPSGRRDQIQSAYPAGNYKWEIIRPEIIPTVPPYETFEIARAGEDAMKARLRYSLNARSLGGEFFLVDDPAIALAWSAGLRAADEAQSGQR